MKSNQRRIGKCGKQFEYFSDQCDFCDDNAECIRTFMTFEDWINEEIERRFPTDILMTFDRDRPYDGQQPEREKTEIKGITFRDLSDCFIRALYDSSGVEAKDYPRTVYDLPLEDMDIMAIQQNMSCWVEKYMGIYPNCPKIDIDQFLKDNSVELPDGM